MIALTTDSPLQGAIDAMDRRSPVGSTMASADWERVPAEVRDRAFWISTLENERALVEARRRLAQVIAQQRDAAEAGGRVMDRGRFVLEMQEVLREVGYVPNPELRGTLQDVSSSLRLSLIWDMNLRMAAGYSQWNAEQNGVSLLRAPAQELIRVEGRVERRDWPRIWAEAGGQFYGEPGGDYPNAPGRMIALKTDPIWVRISQFGVPWAPFAWGSGMGLRNVRRRQAIELGVIEADAEPPRPRETPFNEGLSSSVAGWPEESRAKIQRTWGDAVRFEEDRAVYRRDLSVANPHRHKTISEELRDRRTEFIARHRDPAAGEWLIEALENIAEVETGQRSAVRLPSTRSRLARLRQLLPADLRVEWDANRAEVVVMKGGAR